MKNNLILQSALIVIVMSNPVWVTKSTGLQINTSYPSVEFETPCFCSPIDEGFSEKYCGKKKGGMLISRTNLYRSLQVILCHTPVTQTVRPTSIPNWPNYFKIFAFFIDCHS